MGCDAMGFRRQWEFHQIKQKAAEYAEKEKVDTAIYLTPNGWDLIDNAASDGLDVREIVFFARPSPQ